MQAHALYNSISAREPGRERWLWLAFEVQKELLGDSTNIICSEQLQITRNHKLTLDAMRSNTLHYLNNVQDTTLKDICAMDPCATDTTTIGRFSKEMEYISIICSKQMIDLVAQIIADSIKVLTYEEPPCPFAVVAIGSLARGEATPFSDLEYLFLIKVKDSKTLQYFEKLAYTSYFMIGNLQETKLSYMNIKELRGWFDDRATNGLKIDGLCPEAGNIPTGNGLRNSHIFLTTPKELFDEYKRVLDDPQPDQAQRGDLSAMLTYTKLVFSHQDGHTLLQSFCDMKSHISPNPKRLEANKGMLKHDMLKFNFRPHEALSHDGFTLDIKRELYRFPSILLLDLAILFNVTGDVSWHTLRMLYDRSLVSEEICISLKFILACACYIRLAAYIYHGSHDDRVSIARQMQNIPHQTSDWQQRRWFIPRQVFQRMCQHMLPLKEVLTMASREISEILVQPELSVTDHFIDIEHLYFVGEYKKSLAAMKEYVHIEDNQSFPSAFIQQVSTLKSNDRASKLKVAAEVFFCCHEYDSALMIYKCLTEYGVKHEELHRAACHIHLGQYIEASQVLSGIQAENRNKKSAGLSFTLGNLSYRQGRYREAERYYVTALQAYDREAFNEKLYDYYGSAITAVVSDDNSETNYRDFSKMRPEAILDNIFNATTGIINCLTSLGRVHCRIGDYVRAEKYFSKSLKLLSALYGAEALIPMRATICQSMGSVQKKLRRHHTAMDWYKNAHSQYISIHEDDTQCEDIADVLFNMAHGLSSEGIQTTAAFETMERALGIYQHINPNHRQIDRCKSFLTRYTCSIWLTSVPLLLLSFGALILMIYMNVN